MQQLWVTLQEHSNPTHACGSKAYTVASCMHTGAFDLCSARAGGRTHFVQRASSDSESQRSHCACPLSAVSTLVMYGFNSHAMHMRIDAPIAQKRCCRGATSEMTRVSSTRQPNRRPSIHASSADSSQKVATNCTQPHLSISAAPGLQAVRRCMSAMCIEQSACVSDCASPHSAAARSRACTRRAALTCRHTLVMAARGC